MGAATITASDGPLLTAEELAVLNRRSDAAGLAQLLRHLAVLALGGVLWGLPALPVAVRLMGLLLLGWALAFAF